MIVDKQELSRAKLLLLQACVILDKQWAIAEPESPRGEPLYLLQDVKAAVSDAEETLTEIIHSL